MTYGMCLNNKNENCLEFKRSKLKLFILSFFLPLISFFKKTYEKCLVKFLEVINKILKIEKKSIGEEVRQSIEINISCLYKNYDSYITRKETYLIHDEKENLIDLCKSCLNTCSSFKNRNKLFDAPSNDFIEKSMAQLSHLLNEFEGYDNESFIQERIKRYDSLFQKSPFPLDEAQKRAIVIDDKHNLVVAGAGSGKTEVLITRTAYLIERAPDKVDAKKILILAYQNKAAE
jgi:DNA helicase-4